MTPVMLAGTAELEMLLKDLKAQLLSTFNVYLCN